MRTLRMAVLATAIVCTAGGVWLLCPPLRRLASTLVRIAWYYVVTGSRG